MILKSKNKDKNPKGKGFSGILAGVFINSPLTPVIAIASILLGIMAVYLTPKEEEPQISVPMLDIQIAAPGYEADEVERKITEPVERAIWGLEGVEYIYSSSSPHGTLVTVRFKVGEPVEPALVKVHHKMMEIKSALPPNAGTPQVKAFSIDDVPFLTLTFSSAKRDDYSLRTLVAPLARKLSSTPDISRIELEGGLRKTIHVTVNPDRLSASGISLLDVARKISMNDASAPSGKNWQNKVFDVEIGGRFKSIDDIRNIALGQRGGRVVRISDVATVKEGPEDRTKVSYLLDKDLNSDPRPAVSIVFAKRKGTNVVTLAETLIEHARKFSADLPEDVSMSILRDNGATASEKSKELIEHLIIATLSVSVLIALIMGLRSSFVVFIAIPVTLALTLTIYYFMGYTLNRVTLFALIFSIGILVDDAIVVVENIERHIKISPGGSLPSIILRAVSEVGNPTILATFTVIAAIFPMAFVRGMMGPYMKPIPVGASLAMILSLLIAFIVIPYYSARILKPEIHSHKEKKKDGKLDRLYVLIMEKLLSKRREALKFGVLIVVLLVASFSFFVFKIVKVKMLPFDNKNEFQVLIDYPPVTTLAQNSAWSMELANEILQNKEVKKVQIFSGEPAPYSFSGMVKHSFLRRSEYMTDLQIVLTGKGERKEASHEIIEKMRPLIQKFGKEKSAVTKVLEVPPGPPVLATMVAEIYGPDEKQRQKAAQEIYDIFAKENSVVDLDYSWRKARPRLVYNYDHYAGGLAGVSASEALGAGHLIFSNSDLLSLSEVNDPEEVNVDLSVEQKFRSGPDPFRGEKISSFESGYTYLDGILKKPEVRENVTLFRKNLKPVSYVLSELSGSEESPVYGVMKLSPKIHYDKQTAEIPWDTDKTAVKWDGEWFITYEVFRDLGGAFAVVLVLIYVLITGWFKSYSVPLIIMAPIPISLIGIISGHALMGAYFTATSMIGFIAGAGIIVRNSIILVDFIEQEIKDCMSLKDAVIRAGKVRFRPMLLTAAAVVVGSFIILFDPIFQGLAISLMFGEVAATILSRFAVPVLYYWFIGKRRMSCLAAKTA